MNELDSLFINTQKKRGRKPKPRDENEIIVEKIKKKRGRKPTGKIYEIAKMTSKASIITNNCIIARLPLTEKDITNFIIKNKITKNIIDVNENDVENEINTDTDKNDNENDNENEKEKVEDKQIVENVIENILDSNYIEETDIKNFIIQEDNIKEKYYEQLKEITAIKKKYDELNEKYNKISNLEEKINNTQSLDKNMVINNPGIYDISGNVWNIETKNNCWWCCHGFETIPIGLPCKYIKKKFYLYGCFCSFNCAQSYNLNWNDYKIWERFSLLNIMKIEIFNKQDNNIIYPSPPKEILKIFGGELTIEEYRQTYLYVPKEYYHLLPPMIPIFTIIEEIPKYYYKEFNNNKSGEKVLKIKRTKQIITQNKSLLELFKNQ
jgi:hypothetical protein